MLLADRWHTCFFDLSGDQGLLGQVEGRTADDAAFWLAQAAPAWRDAIEVLAIDMCSIYASAVRRMLPAAWLVVSVSSREPAFLVSLGLTHLFRWRFWSAWAAVGTCQEEPGKAGGRYPCSQGGSLNCGLGREDYRAEAECGTADEEVERALDVP